MTLLLGLAIRSSVVLAVGLLLSACLAKHSAALRHRVLAADAALRGRRHAPQPGDAGVERHAARARAIDAGLRATPALPPHVLSTRRPLRSRPRPAHRKPCPPSSSPGSPASLVAAGDLIAGLVRASVALPPVPSRVEDRRWLQILDTVAGRYGLTRGIVIAQTDSADLLATWGTSAGRRCSCRDHARDWTLGSRARRPLPRAGAHPSSRLARADWRRDAARDPLVQSARVDGVHAPAPRERAGLRRRGARYGRGRRRICRPLARAGQAVPPARLHVGIGDADGSPVNSGEEDCCDVEPATRPPGALAARHGHARRRASRSSRCLSPPFARVRPVRRRYPERSTTSPVPCCRGSRWRSWMRTQIRQVVTSNASGRFEFARVVPGKYVLEAGTPASARCATSRAARRARLGSRRHAAGRRLKETVTVRESRMAAPQQQAPSAPAPSRFGWAATIRAPRKDVDVDRSIRRRCARPASPGSCRSRPSSDATAACRRSACVSAQVHPDFAIAAVRCRAAVALHADAPERRARRSGDDGQRPVRSRGPARRPGRSRGRQQPRRAAARRRQLLLSRVHRSHDRAHPVELESTAGRRRTGAREVHRSPRRYADLCRDREDERQSGARHGIPPRGDGHRATTGPAGSVHASRPDRLPGLRL